MANVRAGAAQPKCEPGQLGIATLWVQSDSKEEALRRAHSIVAARNYQSYGELSIFREETTHAPTLDADLNVEPALGPAAGYVSMKEKAIESADGLFEIWFPQETKTGNAGAGTPKGN